MIYMPYNETPTKGPTMLTKKDLSPITIVVNGPRWEAFGSSTYRSKWLYAMFEKMGGISEEVPDGTYHFNIKRKALRFEASLVSIED